jgi:phospholipase/carboxylesterase
LTRHRARVARIVAITAGALIAGCAGRSDRARGSESPPNPLASRGRLLARVPKAPPAVDPQAGLTALDLGSGGRDGLLYVPKECSTPAPLLLLLHGATGSAKGVTSRLDVFKLADELGFVVLAPDSRGRTWDVIHGHFGPDVLFLDEALEHAFAQVAVDPKRLAIGGFSDGATYALSLGILNGDVFSHVIAFSPGFLVADSSRGKPGIFMSHGTADTILPIGQTSRPLAQQFREAGYWLDYREFDGPHAVPPELERAAFEWFVGKKPAR